VRKVELSKLHHNINAIKAKVANEKRQFLSEEYSYKPKAGKAK
jgi:hypothetical protein